MSTSKELLKNILGDLPLTAEAYWYLRQRGRPLTAKFALTRLQKAIPQWRAEAEAALASPRFVSPSDQGEEKSRHILIFGTLRYWIEQATLLSLVFAGLGHRVTLAYLPYAQWQKPLDRFNLRRHNVYARNILCKIEPFVEVLPLLNAHPAKELPGDLQASIELVALRDTQYTLQVENLNLNEGAGRDLYQLRLQRNLEAAHAAYAWLQRNRPDVVVLPNGTILEFGVIYQTARYLNIPIVTYEYGEQQRRIWLAQNAEVMRQETNDLWAVRKDSPLTPEQLEQVRTLFASRQRASLWENFARRWQGVPSQGGARVRQDLGLDGRPVVLLATNVIGDSLTLGRQVFSDSMTGWLERTVEYFAQRQDVQFIARIHPGELITKGPSVADVVRKVLPNLPEHIHLVPADAQINTYDIIEIADLGLVYTTTVGMEMAMSGVPVIVVGNTHYRSKGFTLDPDTWEAYFETLSRVLDDPAQYRLAREQVDLAWQYAYCFFFAYPHPFPWHILHIWPDLEEWPVARALSPEGQAQFGQTFRYLTGNPIVYAAEQPYE
ncbi:MAG: hypothetical protein JW726_07075 [Anaerolineales bacterium]|nr:hypothetical protein [Anaerolineales bacterium]